VWESRTKIRAALPEPKIRLGSAARVLSILAAGNLAAGHLVHETKYRRNQELMERARLRDHVLDAIHKRESRSITGLSSESEAKAGLRSARHIPMAPPPRIKVRHNRFIHMIEDLELLR
jgi:hypothetical protein